MSRLGLQTVLSETFCLEAPAQWRSDKGSHVKDPVSPQVHMQRFPCKDYENSQIEVRKVRKYRFPSGGSDKGSHVKVRKIPNVHKSGSQDSKINDLQVQVPLYPSDSGQIKRI